MKRIVLAVFALNVLFCLGCGGGGGDGNNGNTQPPAAKPDVTTFKVPAGTATTKSVGNITLEVPEAAFPSGADITVGQSTPTDRPPNEEFVPIEKGAIEITSSAQPKAPITVTVNQTSLALAASDKEVLLFLEKTVSGWSIKNIGEAGKIVIDAGEFIASGANSIVKGLVGKIGVSEVSSESDILQIGSDDSVAPKKTILLMVHGINSRAESMIPLGQFFAGKHQYERIYSYRYDWRNGCSDLAQNLATEISQLTSDGSKMDILAHSMGVVVTRYALERLGKTKNVNNLYAICGANTGSVWATVGELLFGLQNNYLNLPTVERMLVGFPLAEIKSIPDLVQGSQFLQTLNAPKVSQRGLVDYCFIGIMNDPVVGLSSGRADGVPLEDLTAGRVYRYTENGDHASLINHDWETLYMDISNGPRSDGQVTMTIDPNPAYANWDRWNCKFTIKNKNFREIQLTDLSIDRYDRNGGWYSTEWYDPNSPIDAFLPQSPTNLGIIVASLSSYSCSIDVYADHNRDPIDSAPDNMKACVLVFTLRYKGQTGNNLIVATEICQYNSFYPVAPKTRSLALTRGATNNGSTTGRAK